MPSPATTHSHRPAYLCFNRPRPPPTPTSPQKSPRTVSAFAAFVSRPSSNPLAANSTSISTVSMLLLLLLLLLLLVQSTLPSNLPSPPAAPPQSPRPRGANVALDVVGDPDARRATSTTRRLRRADPRRSSGEGQEDENGSPRCATAFLGHSPSAGRRWRSQRTSGG